MSTIKPEEGTEIPQKCEDCPVLKNEPSVEKKIIEGTPIPECSNAIAVYSQLSYQSILNFIYKNCVYGDPVLKNLINKYITTEDEPMGLDLSKTTNLIEYSPPRDTKNYWFTLNDQQESVLDTFLRNLEKSDNEIECTPIPKVKGYKQDITDKINNYITPALVVCAKADYIKEPDNCKKYLEQYDELKLIDRDGEGQEHSLETIVKEIEKTCDDCTIFFPSIMKWEDFTVSKKCKKGTKEVARDNIIGFLDLVDAQNYIQYWASKNATSITIWDKTTGNTYLPPLYIHKLEIKKFLNDKYLLDLTTEQAIKDMKYFSITEDLIINEINNVADLLCTQVFSVIGDYSKPIGTVIGKQLLLCTKNSTIPKESELISSITKESTLIYCPAIELRTLLTKENLEQKSLLQTNDHSIDNKTRQDRIDRFFKPPGRMIVSKTTSYRSTLEALMELNKLDINSLLYPKNVSRSINEVITASITEAMRPYIYQAIEELNRHMKEFGEFIISGGDAINNLLPPNLRQVTPDVDTKFILKYSKFKNCGCTPEDKIPDPDPEKAKNETWCNSDIHINMKQDFKEEEFEGCQSLRQNITNDGETKTISPLEHLAGEQAKKLESDYFIALLAAKHKLWYDALEKLLEKWNDKDFYQRLYYNILMPLEGLVPMNLYNVKFIHPDLRRKRGTQLEPIFKKRYTFMPKKTHSTDSPPFLFDVELFAVDMMIDSLYDIRWDELDGEPVYRPNFEQLFRGNEPRVAGIIDLPFTKPTHLGYNLGDQKYHKEIKLNPYQDGQFAEKDTLIPQQTSLNSINARNAFALNESARASYDDLFYYAPQPSSCITIKVANEKYIMEDVNLLAKLGLRTGTKLEKDLKRLELLQTMGKMDSTATAAATAAVVQADKNYMTDSSIDILSASMNSLSLTQSNEEIENDPTYQQSIPASAKITSITKTINTPSSLPPVTDQDEDPRPKKKSGMLTNSELIAMFTSLIDELSIPIYQSSETNKRLRDDNIPISATKISFGTVNIIGINLGKIINMLAIPNCINKCCTDPVECLSSPFEDDRSPHNNQTGGFIALSPPNEALTGTSVKLDVNLTNERFKYATTDAKIDAAWQDCCDIVPNQFIFRFNSKSLSNWNHKQDTKSTMTDDSLRESQKTFKLVKYIMKEFKNYTKEISKSINDPESLFNLLQPMSYGCKKFFYDFIKTDQNLLQNVCKLMISNILITAISLLNVQDNVDPAICQPNGQSASMTPAEWNKLPKVVKTLATGIVTDLKKTYNAL